MGSEPIKWAHPRQHPEFQDLWEWTWGLGEFKGRREPLRILICRWGRWDWGWQFQHSWREQWRFPDIQPPFTLWQWLIIPLKVGFTCWLCCPQEAAVWALLLCMLSCSNPKQTLRSMITSIKWPHNVKIHCRVDIFLALLLNKLTR